MEEYTCDKDLRTRNARKILLMQDIALFGLPTLKLSATLVVFVKKSCDPAKKREHLNH